MKNKWIINPFNKVFFILMAVCVLLIGSSLKLIQTMQDTKLGLLLFGAISFIVFLYYKFGCIAKDNDYYPECYGCEFTWWGELPLNPCNIITILFPIAVYTNNYYLYVFMFFSSVFATVALFLPCAGFSNVSLLNKRVLFFYVYHYLVLFAGLSTRFCGLYIPKYSDILIYAIEFSFFNLIAYLANDYIVRNKYYLKSNYFFNYDPSENALFQFCYKILPVKGLYIYVLSIPLIIIFALMILLLG